MTGGKAELGRSVSGGEFADRSQQPLAHALVRFAVPVHPRHAGLDQWPAAKQLVQELSLIGRGRAWLIRHPKSLLHVVARRTGLGPVRGRTETGFPIRSGTLGIIWTSTCAIDPRGR